MSGHGYSLGPIKKRRSRSKAASPYEQNQRHRPTRLGMNSQAANGSLSNAARMFTTCSRPMFTTDVRPVFTIDGRVAFTTGRGRREKSG
jgi:hypothetical protein